MRHSISASLLAALLVVLPALAQSPPPKPVRVSKAKEVEEAPGVPMLKDLPILGDLFSRQRGRWVSLDKGGAPTYWPNAALDATEEKLDENAPSLLSFRELWLRKQLRTRYPKLTGIVVEEVKTTVIGERSKRENVSRGFRLFGDAVTVAEAESWMARARSTDSMIVEVEALFIPRKQGTDLSSLGRSVETRVLSKSEVESMARKARSQSGVIAAPRIAVFSGQKAQITVLDEIAYIKDFEVQVVEGAAIADPIIDVVADGITLDVQPLIHPDRRHISLSMDVQFASVQRPIQSVDIVLEPSSLGKVTIQVPSVQRSRATVDDATLKAPFGGLLIQGMARMPKEGAKERVTQPVDVLVQLRAVAMSEAEALAIPDGRVDSVNEDSKVFVAKWPEGTSTISDFKTRRWVIRNNGTQVGTARGVSFAEQLGMFRVTTGRAQVGDTVGQ